MHLDSDPKPHDPAKTQNVQLGESFQEEVTVTDEMKKRTQKIAKKLFGKGIKMTPPCKLWREFDRDFGNDLSIFITGNLHSRTALTSPERQMVACAILAGARAKDKLRLHVI